MKPIWSLWDTGHGSLHEHSWGTWQGSELDRCVRQSLAFRGGGYDSTGTLGFLNDLWAFNPELGTYGEWTWMGGSNTVGISGGGQSGVYGTLGTAASANIPGARDFAVRWSDASGNLWLFGGGGYDSTGVLGDLNDLWKYQP